MEKQRDRLAKERNHNIQEASHVRELAQQRECPIVKDLAAETRPSKRLPTSDLHVMMIATLKLKVS
jgi:hypothetical protein